MPSTIKLTKITKIYRTDTSNTQPHDHHEDVQYALRDVSLTIRPGEILGILGPSGCGKTTLLRIIAGLENPTSGTVTYDGVDLKEIPHKDRGIGMVFQTYALYPHLPSVDNIGFFLKLRKRDEEIPERVQEISRMMRIGLGPLLGRKPPTLSGGERQRVAIARCLARDPRVFLFDEPFSSLDAKLRADMRVELKRLLTRFEVTAAYVTHDQTEAIALTDRIVILNKGQIEQVGTYKQLYETPRNIFVAGFLGSPPMNLFMGHIEDQTWVGKTFSWGSTRSDIPSETSIILGVRPEDLQLDASGRIEAKVELVEPLFPEKLQLVYVKMGSQSAVVKLPINLEINPGDSIRLTIAPDKAHLFDRTSGLRIG